MILVDCRNRFITTRTYLLRICAPARCPPSCSCPPALSPPSLSPLPPLLDLDRARPRSRCRHPLALSFPRALPLPTYANAPHLCRTSLSFVPPSHLPSVCMGGIHPSAPTLEERALFTDDRTGLSVARRLAAGHRRRERKGGV
jgi:hypothetical protein